MGEFLIEYGTFLAKTITIVLALLVIGGSLVTLASRARKKQEEGQIEVKKLNDYYDDLIDSFHHELLSQSALKKFFKERKAALKQRKKEDAKGESDEKKRVFVLDFDGDIAATPVHSLREEITAVLLVARKDDEVVVRLESGGGYVHAYGLAASELKRVRDKNIRLTIIVDKIAASGGYLMACVADKIVAAPFAIIGSIGVIGQMPNFHRFLKKHDIDFEQLTAGEYKRTLTMFGENTAKARDKFQEELEQTHDLFKDYIHVNRPTLDVQQVATGEHWYGQRALQLGLVDELITSDDYLLDQRDTADIYQVNYRFKESLTEKVEQFLQSVLAKVGVNLS